MNVYFPKNPDQALFGVVIEFCLVEKSLCALTFRLTQLCVEAVL